jgi:crotonobetainyl-CoA:carnitine CoA-transferase CaiB-like acyl-CoA transferase
VTASLEGLLIADFGRVLAGPYATMLLADAGADVIKIEPTGGEETRRLDPILEGVGGATVSGYFLRLNRSKRSVTLDLNRVADRSVFLDLVERVDVVVENFRPGVMERLGIGYDSLRARNRSIVYCSISGYGHSESPRRNEPAFAAIAEAATGVLGRPAQPDAAPVRLGPPIGDIFPGSIAVSGIAMALYRAARTGEGAHVDIAMYDAMLSLNECAVAMQSVLHRDVNTDQAIAHSAPFDLFAVADGWVCIAVLGEAVWARFAGVIGHPEWVGDPRFTSGAKRAEHMDGVLGTALREWLATRSRVEAVAELAAAGVPACVVQDSADLLADPQATARSMLIDLESYAGTGATVVASPIVMTEATRTGGRAAAPGEHTAEVLHELLGWSPAAAHEFAQRENA